MEAREFVAGLVEEMRALFARLGERQTLEAESGGRLEVATLLKLALQSELEAAELAGFWMPTTPEIEAKMVFARQCGDEMKHYHLIAKRLGELGVDLAGHDPLAQGHSALYHHAKGLKRTVERIAAGPFAREAIAEVRNAQFIAFCEGAGDEETARLYREVIQPDESLHHRLGREFLERHAVGEELQAAVRAATHDTLAIADELSTLVERSTGMGPLPVS